MHPRCIRSFRKRHDNGSVIARRLRALRAVRCAQRPRAVEAGMLECRGTTASFIVGSVTELRCVFRPAGGGPRSPTAPPSAVSASISAARKRRRGVGACSRRPARSGRATWPATTAASPPAPRSASALGANALVGGSNNTFALQPVSVQGQTGLSVAAGVAGLELRPAADRVDRLRTPPRASAAAFYFSDRCGLRRRLRTVPSLRT